MGTDMLRRQFLQGLGGVPALAQTSRQRPNFIILFTDDQRFSTIRALGNGEIHTPNMDRLAKRGVAFTHAAIMGGTQGAVCVPSRAMLMTGQSLFRAARNTGSTPGEKSAPGPFHLLPELLGQNGYKTFATGKWHNGPKLFSRCFRDGGNIFFGGMSDHLKTPVQDFDPTGAYPKEAIRPGGKFSSELFADTAIDFLRKQSAADPFLLYCAFTSPHDPRMAPTQFTGLYQPAKIKLPPNFLPEHPFDNGELKVRDEMLAPFPRTPEVVREHIAAYYAMVSEVDAQIGRVLDAVESSPFAGNTYIIFAGDNGLAVGQHGLLGKQNVYEHSVRVPLMIAGPTIPRGQRSDSFVYTFDIFPTVCELAGIPVPDTVDGQSLLSPIRNPQERGRESMFFAYRTFQRAIRNREWKLIRYTVGGKETLQLFHIAKDPWEKTNLAQDPAHAQRIRQLSAQLNAWQLRTMDPVAG
jgi:arylsulfatase A-like enzyme